jgi:poly-gamma-glutamate synthesis protein (capsule biosynthesis protein)
MLPGKLSSPRFLRIALLAAFCGTLIGVSIGTVSAHPKPAPVKYPRETGRISFAVAGDVIPHEAVRAAAKAADTTSTQPSSVQGWTALFANVADIFQRADYGFVNFETPVAPAHSHGTKPFLFDAPTDLIDALKASGIKLVSFANNHVMDQGWAGFAESREHLKKQGLLFIGSGDTAATAWQPLIVEKDGIRVGWLGMTRWLNGASNPSDPAQPHVNFLPYPAEVKSKSTDPATLDPDSLIDAVKKARAQCDFLVVSIHWGVEYAPAPRPDDVELAHRILDAGASVIVGHHPHVLQPVESYRTADGRNTLIFYSLGNFLSNQSRNYVDNVMPDKEGDPRDELIAQFSVVKKDYGPAGTQFELADVGILPVWEENNRNEIAAGKTKTTVIMPTLIDREMPKLQARLDQLTKITQPPAPTPQLAVATTVAPRELTADEKKEFIELSNKLKLLDDRRRILLNRTGDEFVIDPPPLPPAK